MGLFVGSFFNMLVLAKIMNKYSFILSTINALLIITGVIYRLQPKDEEFKITLLMVWNISLVGIMWNLFGIATMNSINRVD